jgi:hypothetical protein
MIDFRSYIVRLFGSVSKVFQHFLLAKFHIYRTKTSKLRISLCEKFLLNYQKYCIYSMKLYDISVISKTPNQPHNYFKTQIQNLINNLSLSLIQIVSANISLSNKMYSHHNFSFTENLISISMNLKSYMFVIYLFRI